MVSRVTPAPKAPRAKHKKNVMTGITLAGQMPALEHVRNGHAGKSWRVWLSYDDKYETGVYLALSDDGSIHRYVLVSGAIKKVDMIKGGD